MATKTLTEKAIGGQKFFGLPAFSGTPTATVNGGAAPLSVNPNGVSLTTAAAQGDTVAIIFNSIDDKIAHTEYFTPLTGTTLVPTQWASDLSLTPAGTIAVLTITFPPNPKAGQTFAVRTTQTITALSWTGGTQRGGPTTLLLNTSCSFTFEGEKWNRV